MRNSPDSSFIHLVATAAYSAALVTGCGARDNLNVFESPTTTQTPDEPSNECTFDLGIAKKVMGATMLESEGVIDNGLYNPDAKPLGVDPPIPTFFLENEDLFQLSWAFSTDEGGSGGDITSPDAKVYVYTDINGTDGYPETSIYHDLSIQVYTNGLSITDGVEIIDTGDDDPDQPWTTVDVVQVSIQDDKCKLSRKQPDHDADPKVLGESSLPVCVEECKKFISDYMDDIYALDLKAQAKAAKSGN